MFKRYRIFSKYYIPININKINFVNVQLLEHLFITTILFSTILMKIYLILVLFKKMNFTRTEILNYDFV